MEQKCENDRDDVFRECGGEDEDGDGDGEREIFRRVQNSNAGTSAQENSLAPKSGNELVSGFRPETEDEKRKMELIRLIDKKLTRVREMLPK